MATYWRSQNQQSYSFRCYPEDFAGTQDDKLDAACEAQLKRELAQERRLQQEAEKAQKEDARRDAELSLQFRTYLQTKTPTKLGLWPFMGVGIVLVIGVSGLFLDCGVLP